MFPYDPRVVSLTDAQLLLDELMAYEEGLAEEEAIERMRHEQSASAPGKAGEIRISPEALEDVRRIRGERS